MCMQRNRLIPFSIQLWEGGRKKNILKLRRIYFFFTALLTIICPRTERSGAKLTFHVNPEHFWDIQYKNNLDMCMQRNRLIPFSIQLWGGGRKKNILKLRRIYFFFTALLTIICPRTERSGAKLTFHVVHMKSVNFRQKRKRIFHEYVTEAGEVLNRQRV